MADDKEKFLAPIREICRKLISTSNKNNINSYSEELLKKSAKAFYKVNINIILVNLLTENPNLEDDKVSEIFRILSIIFENEKEYKKNLIIPIHNLFLTFKNENISQCILESALKFIKLTDVPEPELTSSYFTMTEMSIRQKKLVYDRKNREIMNSNIRILMRNCNDEKGQKNLFRILQNSAYLLRDHMEEFLTTAVYQGFKECPNFKIQNDEIFTEYIDFIDMVISANKLEDQIVEKLSSIILIVEKCLHDKDHKLLNTVLHKCINVLTRENITLELLNDCKNCLKNVTPSSKSNVQHRAIHVISTLLTKFFINLELSEKCYTSCHDLVFSLFNVLKYVKNKETRTQKCCQDIKRHAIFSLTLVMASYGTQMIDSDLFTKKVAQYFQYHIDYALTIYKQVNCSSKPKMFVELSQYMTIAWWKLIRRNDNSISNINVLAQVYKSYVNMEESQKDDMDVRKLTEMGVYLSNIDIPEDTKAENAQIYAETVLYPILFSQKLQDVKIKKMVLKLVFRLHQTIKILNYNCVLDYVNKKVENSEIAKFANDICFDEFIVMEMEAIHRYNNTPNDITKLFMKINENKIDMERLARACLTISDTNIKTIDLKKFKDLNDRLEKYHIENDTNIKFSLALASNNYYISFVEGHNLEDAISSTSKDLLAEIPDCLSLENELKIVNRLDKFLEYITDILFKLKEDPSELENFPSVRLFIYMLENVSTQYFVRGIANKDLETKLVLWHFLQYQDNPESVLDTASFFLDNMNRLIGNSGHYLNISKRLNYLRIEEIIPKANKALESLLEGIDKKSEAKQTRALNYMLSLWSYFKLLGRKSDADDVWRNFRSTTKICTLKSPLYVCIIEAKKLVFLAEFFIKCHKRNCVDYLYKAIILLQEIKTIYTDYSNNFQFLFRTLVLKVIIYSLNRMVDLEHCTTTMLTLKNQAIRKGLFVKTLEIYSLSVLRNLNMEKLDDAKDDLKKMSKMLKLEDNILIETPISVKPIIHVPNMANSDMTVRKAIPNNHSSRKSVIEIFNDSRNENNELVEELQTFVHQNSCKCSMCQFPLLKFIIFQMGCHYSRLLFMISKFDLSKSFNDYALEPWRLSSMKILRSKDCVAFGICKQDFVNFSIRWLFQVADTFIRTKDYSCVEEVYTEVELLCTSNIEDYECVKQNLLARLQNLEFLMKHENDFLKINTESKDLDFKEFLKIRKLTPVPSSKSKTSKKTSPKDEIEFLTPKSTSVKVDSSQKSLTRSASHSLRSQSTASKNKAVECAIYIDLGDSDDEIKEKPKPKKTVKVPQQNSRTPKAKTPEIEIVETPRTRLKRL